MKQSNLNVIRMIQIAKDISTNEIAQAFVVTSSEVSAVKAGKRNFKFETLKRGLHNLSISLTSYAELEEFKCVLEKEPLDESLKYGCMLAKTIGVIFPEQRDVAEAVVEAYLNKRASIVTRTK